MSGHDDMEDANVDDGGMTGPGAPTPLTALEVSHTDHDWALDTLLECDWLNMTDVGHRGPDKTRHSTDCRRRVQHGRVCRVHTAETTRADQGHLGAEGGQDPCRRYTWSCTVSLHAFAVLS
jgi:hypothetical protein